MKAEELIYSVDTEKTFEEAVVSVLKNAGESGWSLFQVYDIKERLAAKGFHQRPLKIIEICKASNADGFLGKDRLASLCMPCRINVMQEGKVRIAGMRPTIMIRFFPSVDAEHALSVEKELKGIIDSSR